MGLCQSHCWLGHSHHTHFLVAGGIEVNHIVLFLVVERIDLETLYLTIDGATILHSDYHLIADLKFEVCHKLLCQSLVIPGMKLPTIFVPLPETEP